MSWFLLGLPTVVFAGLFIPIAMGKAALWDFDTLFMVTTVGIVLVIAVLLVKTTTLSLTQDAIHYRSLLRSVHIELADVAKVEYAFGFIAFSYKPYQRIVVTVLNKAGDEEIVLNGGLFDQREIKKWVDACHSVLHRK